jgi:hypothetical protein
MKTLAATLVVTAATVSMAPAQAPSTRTFTGTISDEMCALAGHASMRMGPTDEECTTACVMIHGASYVLVDGKDVYVLSDQRTPESFAAKRVRVVGTLDEKTKTITVTSIAEAK